MLTKRKRSPPIFFSTQVKSCTLLGCGYRINTKNVFVHSFFFFFHFQHNDHMIKHNCGWRFPGDILHRKNRHHTTPQFHISSYPAKKKKHTKKKDEWTSYLIRNCGLYHSWTWTIENNGWSELLIQPPTVRIQYTSC